MLKILKKLHSIDGKPSTKLVAGSLCFLAFIAVAIYATIDTADNSKIQPVLFALESFSLISYGISSVDVLNLYKIKNKNG